MSRRVILERFYEVLISGDRNGSRAVVDECLQAEVPAEEIIERLFWPTLDHIEELFRDDHLSVIAHNYAMRILRMLADQMQLRLSVCEEKGRRLFVVCGPDEENELACQMAVDMLEAGGHEVYFGGSGIADDEIVNQIGQIEPAAIVMFSSAPSDLPHIRKLIDYLHDMGIGQGVQIVVGGGVFNRADELAEEIGADVWATTPMELVKVVSEFADKRAGFDQRTVGRRRRQSRSKVA